MRATTHALTVTLGGLAALMGLMSCGQPSTLGDSGATATTVARQVDAPTFGVQQVRALHYIIDRREEGDKKLVADATVYSDGRIVVTAEVTAADFGAKGWISIRLSNLAGRTIWINDWTTPLCVTRTCPSTRKETWTFRTTPRIASQASNLWIKLDILQ